MISIVRRPELYSDELAAVRALVDAVAVADGTAAYSEPVMLDLAASEPPADTSHLLAHDDGVLVAYAHVDASTPDDLVVEAAVRPEHRRRGIGTAVADQVAAELPSARAWAHGDQPGAARLAERIGLRRARELWQMRRPPAAGPLPELVVPGGVEIRPIRVGVDEEAIVAVNNRAFAWHPEQSGWTVAAVAAIEAEHWFDADGVLLAWDTGDGGALLGFHWTKVHEHSASVPEPLGEVYVVGVDPAAQGRRLGSALTLAGLHRLAAKGLDTVILYVEGDNAAAIATYCRLGFEQSAVDVSYQR